MSSLALFSIGAAIFSITVIATLTYGYTVVRRIGAKSLASASPPPALYSPTETTTK